MKKRFWAVFMMLIMTCFLVSCGQKEQTAGAGDADRVPEREVKVSDYKPVYVNLKYGYEFAFIEGDDIYGVDRTDTQQALICQDKTSAAVKKQIALSPELRVTALGVDNSGDIYFSAVKEQVSRLYMVNENDQCVELDSPFLEEKYKSIVQAIYIDEQDTYYIWQQYYAPIEELYPEDAASNVYVVVDEIIELNDQFQVLQTTQIPQYQGTQLLSFQMVQDQGALLVMQDKEGIYIQKIGQQGTEPVYVSSKSFGLELFGASEKGVLYSSNGVLYEYDAEKGEETELLNLSAYGFMTDELMYLKKTDDTIELVDTYAETGASEYTTLTKGAGGKQVLTMAVIEQKEDLQKVVAAFNRYSEKYMVEMIEYYENSYDDALTKFKLEVVSGKAPDLINASLLSTSVSTNKGIFLDLYDFMENDTELTKEQLISTVIEPYEVDGHLYYIAPSFQLYSLCGSNQNIQGRSGVTLAELKSILAESGKDLNAVWGFSADEPVITTLCTFGMDEFIDWDTRTCDFTSEYFADVLEFVKECNARYKGSLSKGIEEGEILLSTSLITSVSDYQIENEVYGGEAAFLGYPTKEGSGTVVSMRGDAIGINAKTACQEGAWEFVKFYILNGYDGSGFPVEAGQFDACMSLAMQKEYGWDPDNSSTFELAKGRYADDDRSFEVYEASWEDIDAVRRLVEQASGKFEYDTVITDIVREEADAYLKGAKTAAEVSEIIQNRVSLYLSEGAE